MRSNITGGWFIELPDVISHSHAVQPVIAEPAFVNHPPRSVRDDLSRTDSLVSELSRKLVAMWGYDRIRPHHPAPLLHGFGLRLGRGWGDVRRFIGRRWPIGSRVGDTGSSNGMTVDLLIGCPICAMATPPDAVFDCPLVLNIASVATIPNVR